MLWIYANWRQNMPNLRKLVRQIYINFCKNMSNLRQNTPNLRIISLSNSYKFMPKYAELTQKNTSKYAEFTQFHNLNAPCCPFSREQGNNPSGRPSASPASKFSGAGGGWSHQCLDTFSPYSREQGGSQGTLTCSPALPEYNQTQFA